VHPGEDVTFAIQREKLHVFDAEMEEAVRFLHGVRR
jgi:hypothetical protein